MIKNYFKTAWRMLFRSKLYSVINIAGLSIGLAACMLIMVYVEHEYSYDRFHGNAGRIYWIQGKMQMGNDSIFMPKMSFATAPIAKEHDPDVESFVRINQLYNAPVLSPSTNVTAKFSEDKFLFADSNFFSFFTFPLEKGNKYTVLQQPFSLVISAAVAQKYFGSADPVGKTIRFNDQQTFTITGIAKKVPSNSSMDFDFVASASSMASMNDYKALLNSQQVQLGSFNTYFLLNHPKSIHNLEATLMRLNRDANNGKSAETYYGVAFADTHLKSNFGDYTNTKYLTIFIIAAALILLLALTNYMSLSTARATIRAKEVGVRKVVGADRWSITMQFFIESILYTFISFLFAYIIFFYTETFFFRLIDLPIDSSFLYNSYLIVSFLLLFIATSVLAATYPSVILSAFVPVQVLYSKFSKQKGGLGIRRFFTIVQFSTSIALLICSIVIRQQISYIVHKDTGVNRENVVMIPFTSSIGKYYPVFKKDASSLPGVLETSTAHYPMYKGFDAFFAKNKKSEEDMMVSVFSVDQHFIPMMGLKWRITPVNDFYKLQNQIILNGTAVEKLDLGVSPLHQQVKSGNQQYEVAGVLKDFNYQSLQEKIGSACLFVSNDTLPGWGQGGGCFFAKIAPGTQLPKLIGQIKSLYEKYDHQKPFTFSFMDDAFNSLYKAEDRLAKLISAFTVFIVMIAFMGLFGLITFIAEQKTKEIGIRKVLGATVINITALLSKDFIQLIAIACGIAFPIAWWLMYKWLQGFAYKIDISWWVFVLSGLVVTIIATGTISIKAIKAAMDNPVKSIKTE